MVLVKVNVKPSLELPCEGCVEQQNDPQLAAVSAGYAWENQTPHEGLLPSALSLGMVSKRPSVP